MNDNYLLDTNITIRLLTGDASTQAWIEQAAQVFIPVISAGELYYGVLKSQQVETNRARLETLLFQINILLCDAETARIYGRIKVDLMAKGRAIPENDIWIAAIAIQHNLTLATADAHFEQIDALKTEFI